MKYREIKPAITTDDVIVGENTCESIKRNYNRVAIMAAILAGKEVVLVEEGEEYKSLCENLGIEHIKSEQTN